MRRPELEKLLDWAMSQPIPMAEKLVLVDMVRRCTSPYLQVPYSQRQCVIEHGLGRTTVKRAVKSLVALGLIEGRGRKPMDDHRYVNIWQLNADLKVGATQDPNIDKEGATEDPTSGGHPGPHHPDLSTGGVHHGPQLSQNDPELSTGGVHTGPPIKNNIYTNSLQRVNRGAVVDPTPEKEGASQDPTPPNGQPLACLTNLPPNANRDLARLIEIYPPIAGEQSFTQADGELRERLREGHTVSRMVEGVKRYRAYVEATSTSPEFTMHLKRFIGPDLNFDKPWTIDPTRPKPGQKLSKLERAEAAYRKAGYYDHEH